MARVTSSPIRACSHRSTDRWPGGGSIGPARRQAARRAGAANVTTRLVTLHVSRGDSTTWHKRSPVVTDRRIVSDAGAA